MFVIDETYIGDHFVYASSQWEKMLQCDVIFHWLGVIPVIYDHYQNNIDLEKIKGTK